MISPNKHFEGTPIEFKEINPKDFEKLFDEDGNSDADGTQGTANLLKNLNNLMFEGNGIIKLNPITQVPNPYVVSSEINQNQRTCLRLRSLRSNGYKIC